MQWKISQLQAEAERNKYLCISNATADSELVSLLTAEVAELRCFHQQVCRYPNHTHIYVSHAMHIIFQVLQERNEHLNAAIELQVLRDKVLRSQQQAVANKQLLAANEELAQRVAALEAQLQLADARSASHGHGLGHGSGSSTGEAQQIDDMRLLGQVSRSIDCNHKYDLK